MKSIYSYIFIALAAFLFIGCEEDEGSRIPELQSGASFRIDFPDPQYSLLNFNEPEEAMLQFDIYTVNDDIDVANLYMTYYNNAQDQQYDTVLFRTYEQADFDADGAIRNVQITPTDIANAIGISEDILGGSDRIEIFTEIVLQDGRVYPDEVRLPGRTEVNVEPGITQGDMPSFSTGFTAFIACPLPDDFAVGTYRVEQIEGPADDLSGSGNPYLWATEEVTLTAPSTISRRFAGTYYSFTDVTFNLQFVCGTLTAPYTNSGIGCGSGGLAWQTLTPGTYSLESDEEFVIQVNNNVEEDCGAPVDPVTLRLTKVN